MCTTDGFHDYAMACPVFGRAFEFDEPQYEKYDCCGALLSNWFDTYSGMLGITRFYLASLTTGYDGKPVYC